VGSGVGVGGGAVDGDISGERFWACEVWVELIFGSGCAGRIQEEIKNKIRVTGMNILLDICENII
jgi:hypothetical protein